MKRRALFYKIWDYCKVILYSLLALVLAGLLACTLFGATLEIKWLSYIVQILVSLLFAGIAIGMPTVIAKDYDVVFPWDNNKKVKKYLGWTTFIILSAAMIGILSYIRKDSHKQSTIIMVKNETDYSINKVDTGSPFEITAANKKISLIPKKDSVYIMNLSTDTLYLHGVDYRQLNQNVKRSWGKTRITTMITKERDSIYKTIPPLTIDCCGAMDGLDIFKSPNYYEGFHRRVLTRDKDPRF